MLLVRNMAVVTYNPILVCLLFLLFRCFHLIVDVFPPVKFVDNICFCYWLLNSGIWLLPIVLKGFTSHIKSYPQSTGSLIAVLGDLLLAFSIYSCAALLWHTSNWSWYTSSLKQEQINSVNSIIIRKLCYVCHQYVANYYILQNNVSSNIL